MKFAKTRCDFIEMCRGLLQWKHTRVNCWHQLISNAHSMLVLCFLLFHFWLLTWSSDYEPYNTRNSIRTIWFVHDFFCSLLTAQTLNSAAIDCEAIGNLNSKQHFILLRSKSELQTIFAKRFFCQLVSVCLAFFSRSFGDLNKRE